MKKFLTVLLGGFLIFGLNLSAGETKNFSVVELSNQQQNKYTPPPARYAPPQTPNYGGEEPAYTPPPPPEPKR